VSLLPGLERPALPALPRAAELAALLAAPRTAMVKLLVVRRGHGKKLTPDAALLSVAGGLDGDRWAAFRPARGRQITLMDARVARLLVAREGAHDLQRPGDNLLVDHATSRAALPTGTRLRVGSALIEINDVPHLGCKKFEARFGRDALAWVNDEAHRDLRLRGIHAIVIADGRVAIGDTLVVERQDGA